MRLNGIVAEPGTVIGYHQRTKRFLTIDKVDKNDCELRYSTPEELTAIGTREPRSVTEHFAIPLRMTPFGPARMFGPRPKVKPQVVTKKQAKRFVQEFNNRYPGIVNGDNGR